MQINHTIAGQVYEILKQKIVSGEFQIGEQLKEIDVAQKLNVSRSPVREAFRQLASDGLIDNVANKGAYVREITARDVEDIMDIRHVFEKKGIFNLQNLPKSRVEPLHGIRANMVRTFEAKDYREYSAWDFELHKEITAYSDNKMIDLFSVRLYSMIQMFRNIALKNTDRFQSSFKEHLDIIDSLLAGDYDKAWTLNREHLIQTGYEIKSFLYTRESRYEGKVGILGGAFDPIHNGHLHFCELMMRELELDKILLIPSYRPVHKQDSITASFADRMELCRLATEDDPRYLVEDTESRLYEVGYFCDTLRQYTGFLDNIHLLLGPDTYLSLSYWKDNEYILKNTTLCTVLTPKASAEMRDCKEHFDRMGGDTVFVESSLLPVSSTQIRENMQGSRQCLPPKVYDYIKANHLYGE